MDKDGFCRNNRGVNDNEDFPREFLEAIYDSISATPFRVFDASDNATAIPEVAAGWSLLARKSKTPRGTAMLLPLAGETCF